MTFVRFSILILAVLPALIVPLIVKFAPGVFTGGEELSMPSIWSFVGLGLSYYGLLFSLYAALEVANLSTTYHFKLRSPEISKRLATIARKVSAFAGEPSQDLRSQGFIYEALVALRAAKRIKNRELQRVAKEADKALAQLTQQAKLHRRPGETASQVPGFWDFFQKISELSDEFKSQLDDVRAVQ